MWWCTKTPSHSGPRCCFLNSWGRWSSWICGLHKIKLLQCGFYAVSNGLMIWPLFFKKWKMAPVVCQRIHRDGHGRQEKKNKKKEKKKTHTLLPYNPRKKKKTSPRDKLVILGKHKTSSKEGMPILLPKRKWRHQIS